MGRRNAHGTGHGRGILALAFTLALGGGALFLRGCPSQGVCLVADALTFACLLLCLGGVVVLLRLAAPRRPDPKRDVPEDGFGTR